jgi:hypothetical protein
MGKVWVLDTETKGTGAQMVPLEKVLERRRSAPSGDRISVIRRGADSGPGGAVAADEAAEPRPPRRFRVVNSITRQVLADDATTQEAVEALGRVRSVIEATVYVRDGAADEWIPLTLREQKAMWEFRGR